MNYPKPAIFEPEVLETVVYVSVPQYDFAHVITKESLFQKAYGFSNFDGAALNSSDQSSDTWSGLLSSGSSLENLELSREPIEITLSNRAPIDISAVFLSVMNKYNTNFGNHGDIILTSNETYNYQTLLDLIEQNPIRIGLIEIEILRSSFSPSRIFRSMNFKYANVNAFGVYNERHYPIIFDPTTFNPNAYQISNVENWLLNGSGYQATIPGNTTVKFKLYPIVDIELRQYRITERANQRRLDRMEAKAKYIAERMRAREQKAEARRNRR